MTFPEFNELIGVEEKYALAQRFGTASWTSLEFLLRLRTMWWFGGSPGRTGVNSPQDGPCRRFTQVKNGKAFAPTTERYESARQPDQRSTPTVKRKTPMPG